MSEPVTLWAERHHILLAVESSHSQRYDVVDLQIDLSSLEASERFLATGFATTV